MSIHSMAVERQHINGDPVMAVLFKLRPVSGNRVEMLPLSFKRYGFGPNVMRALGYSQREDGVSYVSVERDRFKDGPVYIQVAVNGQGKIVSVKRFVYHETGPQPIEIINIPELVEA